MTLTILVNLVFGLMNLKWARDSFVEGREGWGWFFLFCSAWCTAGLLMDLL